MSSTAKSVGESIRSFSTRKVCSNSKMRLGSELPSSLYSKATSPISSSGQSQLKVKWKSRRIHGNPDSLVVCTMRLVGKRWM